MGAMASQITSLTIVYSTVYLSLPLIPASGTQILVYESPRHTLNYM